MFPSSGADSPRISGRSNSTMALSFYRPVQRADRISASLASGQAMERTPGQSPFDAET